MVILRCYDQDYTFYYNISRMKDVTKMLSWEFLNAAINNPLQNEKCVDMHHGTCNQKAVSQFVMGCQSVFKMYLLVHLIPFIMFKRKKVMKDPKSELKKLVVGFVKSLLFAGGYSFFIRRIVCWVTQFYKYTQYCSVLSAVFGSFTLLFQSNGRQAEIALFCLTKTMQVSYNMLRRRDYPVNLPQGQCILMGSAAAIISFTFLQDSKVYRQNYKAILQKVFKDI